MALGFSDIQEKAMMGMNIIPSIFLEKFNTNEMKDMVEIFEYYVDDLPHPGSFEAELLQWQVNRYISEY